MDTISGVVSDQPSVISAQVCDFCVVSKTKTTQYFTNFYGSLPHTLDIPGIPGGFTVLQDLVPIAEFGGHVLFLPNTHYVSLATVKDQQAVADARDAIFSGLRTYFPDHPLFVFEHGPGIIEGEPIACGGCHFDHAHGHIMIMPKGTGLDPIQKRMEQILTDNGWETPRTYATKTDAAFAGLGSIVGIQPYLHMGMVSPDGTTVAYTYIQKKKSFGVPSQLLRAVVAEVVYAHPDSTYWHWRDLHMGLTTDERMTELKHDVLVFRSVTKY